MRIIQFWWGILSGGGFRERKGGITFFFFSFFFHFRDSVEWRRYLRCRNQFRSTCPLCPQPLSLSLLMYSIPNDSRLPLGCVCVCWPLRTTVSLYNFCCSPESWWIWTLGPFLLLLGGWLMKHVITTCAGHVVVAVHNIFCGFEELSREKWTKERVSRQNMNELDPFFVVVVGPSRNEKKRKKRTEKTHFHLYVWFAKRHLNVVVFCFFVCCNLFLGVLVRVVEWPSLSER